MWIPAALASAALFIGPAAALGQEVEAVRPLLTTGPDDPWKFLPQNARLLNDAAALEQWLVALDGAPPDWTAVYGRGHQDPGHDDRLFALNRQRDAKREGKPAMQWRIAFVWHGELSDYDPRAGGFHVALGPKFIATQWGVVRFKPENLPGNMTAIPNPSLRETLRRRVGKGERIEIDVVMTGRAVPEEFLIYAFSHDEEGQGLIMPVVRIERVDFVIR